MGLSTSEFFLPRAGIVESKWRQRWRTIRRIFEKFQKKMK